MAAAAERFTRYKKVSEEKILKILSHCNKMQNRAAGVGLAGLMIMGLLPLWTWITFANQMYQEGVHTVAAVNNSTLQLPDPADLNISSSQIQRIDETHWDLTISPACPQYTILSVFVLNLLGYAIDCSDFLVGAGYLFLCRALLGRNERNVHYII